MQTTERIMQSYRVDEYKNLSLEMLSVEYRKTHEDAIIAEAFEKVKRLIVINTRNYPQFEVCDTISFALEKLTMCLLTYVPGSSSKFTTYFCKVYKRKLIQETQDLNRHKRCIVFKSESLDALVENNNFDVADSKNVDKLVILPDNLTEKEKTYCNLLAMDYGTNKEIAEYMNVSVMCLCNLRKSLKIKLKDTL